MKKRILALLTAVFLVVGMVPATVVNGATQYGTTTDGLKYKVYPDHIEITAYIGSAAHLIIPDTIEGLPVTIIGELAFDHNDSLINVVIPYSVSIIGSSAFYGCDNLTSINIPRSVTTIDSGAFNHCDTLSSVEIPDSVTTIGFNAFRACKSLIRVDIPSSVTTIGNHAFSLCTNLTGIYVDRTNPSYSSDDRGVLFDKQKTQLIQAPGTLNGSYTIPNTVTIIGNGAFGCCSNLTSVNIPDSVTTIDPEAFQNCDSLTSLEIPDSVNSIDYGAIAFCDSLISVAIGDNVSIIGDNAFSHCGKLTSIEIGRSVATIGEWAFHSCYSLDRVTFSGNAPLIDPYAFPNVSSTAYYPANNLTWTSDVLQHYGGTITWVPYTPVDPPETIDGLTELDYWVLSNIAYWDFDSYLNRTLKEALVGMGKWNKRFEDTDMKYSELCEAIGHWKIVDVDNYSSTNGFYGVTFANGDDAVIAYRGSIPLTSLDAVMSMDALFDWVLNDLYPIVTNRVFSQGQYKNAIAMYENADKAYTNIAVTGHSLGGGLADIISAHYGCKGVSMNAISILDAFYTRLPKLFGSSFAGVDKWNFVDHANQYDMLAGSFEVNYRPITTILKPVVQHTSNVDPNLLKVLEYHSLGSYITRDANGTPALTNPSNSYIPINTISNYMATTGISIDLGSSSNNIINKSLSVSAARTSYGGDGQDTISTNAWSDTIIGGRGHDELDGGWGNDTYAYYKGDGVDTIHDIGGNDRLILLGFDENDTFSVMEDSGSDYIRITNGGVDIIKISKKNREYALVATNRFKIVLDHGENAEAELFDITDAFYKYSSGEHLYISCPVHVEVLDSSGNVVHTLTDGEIGTWYTDYGSFYVFEEENGEYGKVLDLAVGCTVRIVGDGEGTMDVTYQIPAGGELTDPVSVFGVPVTENLTATIMEKADGEVYLVIDEDHDGEADSERKLYGECPFTDVPEDSFYYEPVLWAVEEGITSGTSADTFAPNNDCLRAQVVTFLWRAAGEPEPTSERNPFVDVKPSDFYYKAVLWAVENNITNGADATHFNPMGICNRAQVVTFLYRAFRSPAVENTDNPFTDVPEGSFYRLPVLWAVENGITNGLSATQFGPNANCNRAQIVTFLYRAYN